MTTTRNITNNKSKLISCLRAGWEKKLTPIIENKKSYIVIGFCNVSLFKHFWRFPGIFIEKPKFEEFEEIRDQMNKE